jgi:hypothetical protein
MMKKFLLILGLLILIAGCTTGGNVTGQGDNQEDGTSMSSESGFSIGESVVVSSGLRMMIKSVVVTPYYTYYSTTWNKKVGYVSSPGTNFVLFDVELENTGSSEIPVYRTDFSFKDNGNIYNKVYYGGDDALELSSHLQPGTKRTGKLLFEVPDTIEDSSLVFDSSTVSRNSTITWDYDMIGAMVIGSISAEISIRDVETSVVSGEGFTQRSIKYIYYKVNNTGDTGIMPIINYTITYGTTTISTGSASEEVLVDGTTKNGQVAVHAPLSNAGEYTVMLDLMDSKSNALLSTITGEVQVS